MCGRYTLALPAVQIQNRFHAQVDPDAYAPVYNAAPGMFLPVITNEQPDSVNLYRWGLVPFWAKDVRIGYKMINARSETLGEKPAFRQPLKQHRCLVPADGFYEWKQVDKKTKIPHRFMLRDGGLFAMAGLWSIWRDAEERPMYTFSIITVGANPLVAPLHDRMPAMLPLEQERLWLDTQLPLVDSLALLRPYSENEMKAYRVDEAVNKAANNYPELLEQVEA